MASTRSFLFIVVILALLHSFNIVPSKFVQNFCRGQDNLHACLSAITLDPKSTTVSNYHDLVQIILKLARTNTTHSKNLLIASKRKYNPYAMKGCIDGFQGASLSFNSVLMEVDEDLETCNYDVFVARYGAAQCESFFQHAKIKYPPKISSKAEYIILYSILGSMIT
ncbi:uncharacterized protein [Rutidosis leptorrhynchoides]|uniref:uncharacterized protein n=1 Tax=Rutidosis leptorrhynchoides TaxID=125765 RepID=UPI003A9A508C